MAMKCIIVVLAIAMLVTTTLSSEVFSLDGEDTTKVYRVSYTCGGEVEDHTSQGIYTIDITGESGDSTGALPLVVNPGYVCQADGDTPRCYTSNLGVEPSEDARGGDSCGCDPTLHEDVEYDDTKWSKEPDQHRLVYLVGKDVGTVKSVSVKSTSTKKGTGVWKIKSLKINTIDQVTATGPGIYYVGAWKLTPSSALEADVCATTSGGPLQGLQPVSAPCNSDNTCASGKCDTGGEYGCDAKCVKEDADSTKAAEKNCPELSKQCITFCNAQTCEELDRYFQ